jgi:predicted transcriptional regulator
MAQDFISEIEQSAATNGVEMREALQEAGIAATTFMRWQKGRFDPRMSTVRRLQDAIEAVAARKRVA